MSIRKKKVKSEVMRCSRFGVQMYMRLNGEPLEAVDCFKHLGSQMAVDGGCERDEVAERPRGYKASGGQKSMLSNRGFG